MRKLFLGIIAALMLMLAPVTAAHATGSDSPTPYVVDEQGITLPAGDTFKAHGHVNIKYTDAEGSNERSAGIHFDPNNNQPGGAWISESFMPWTAFGLTDNFCIVWTQVHGYNEHYGEGKNKPVVCVPPVPPVDVCEEDQYGPGCEVPPAPPVFEDYEERVGDLICEANATGYGTITTEARDGVREPVWSATAWAWVLPMETLWGDWAVIGEERVKDAKCDPIANSGTTVTPALIGGAAALFIVGGVLLSVATRRTAR